RRPAAAAVTFNLVCMSIVPLPVRSDLASTGCMLRTTRALGTASRLVRRPRGKVFRKNPKREPATGFVEPGDSRFRARGMRSIRGADETQAGMDDRVIPTARPLDSRLSESGRELRMTGQHKIC